MLPKIKEAMAAEEVIPFSISRDLWRAIGTTSSTFLAEPLDEQGVFKIESPEWMDMIGMFKSWIDAGLARFDVNDVSIDAWQKGQYAMSLGSHSWVRLGRQVWGPELVKGGTPPQANAEAPKRTWAHIDSACVFNEAPHPQEATDWALSLFGPEGAPAETWWSGTLQFSGSPVHQHFIDTLVTPNPEIVEVGEVLALLPDSPNRDGGAGQRVQHLPAPDAGVPRSLLCRGAVGGGGDGGAANGDQRRTGEAGSLNGTSGLAVVAT